MVKIAMAPEDPSPDDFSMAVLQFCFSDGSRRVNLMSTGDRDGSEYKEYLLSKVSGLF